jgi:hypothetical protein
VETAGIDNKIQFHKRKAWVPTSTSTCKNVEVGLVGLHIAQKTHRRPFWIWSTFEHVNNAPDAGSQCGAKCGPFIFNKLDQQKMPSAPERNPPFSPAANIYNVERAWHLVNVRTQDMNAKYWKELGANSKWAKYELVMTNWTFKPTTPGNAGEIANTFPTAEVNSAYANTAMETFFQNKMSCLACHVNAVESDFMWSLKIEPQHSRERALQQLKRLTEGAGVPWYSPTLQKR